MNKQNKAKEMPDEIWAQIDAHKLLEGSWWSTDDGNTPWLTSYIKKSKSISTSNNLSATSPEHCETCARWMEDIQALIEELSKEAYKSSQGINNMNVVFNLQSEYIGEVRMLNRCIVKLQALLPKGE